MSRIIYSISAFFILIVVFSKCSPLEEVSPIGFPGLNTLNVSNVSKEGVTFNAELLPREGAEILQYGFVWGEDNYPIISNTSDRVVFSKKMKGEKFSANISSSLREGVGYYVKAFVTTEEYTIYGKAMEFKSMGSSGPEFISFSPAAGESDDTIQFIGKNFSYIRHKNLVKFGETEGFVISASDTLLSVIVPSVSTEDPVKLSVSILGKTSTAAGTFTFN